MAKTRVEEVVGRHALRTIQSADDDAMYVAATAAAMYMATAGFLEEANGLPADPKTTVKNSVVGYCRVRCFGRLRRFACQARRRTSERSHGNLPRWLASSFASTFPKPTAARQSYLTAIAHRQKKFS